MCTLHQAISTHAPAFKQFRYQLEWNAHHWRRLAERLRQPVQVQSSFSQRLGAPYSSALYGKMDDTDMDVTHGR